MRFVAAFVAGSQQCACVWHVSLCPGVHGSICPGTGHWTSDSGQRTLEAALVGRLAGVSNSIKINLSIYLTDNLPKLPLPACKVVGSLFQLEQWKRGAVAREGGVGKVYMH